MSRGAHSPVGLIAPAVVERFRGDERFAAAVVAFFGQRPELIRDVFSAQEVTRTLLDLTDGPRTGRDAADEDGDDDGGGEAGVRGGPGRGTGGFDAAEFRALRDARGLSRLDVARLATGLWPDEPVSEDQLRMFEAGGRPRIRHLPSRLDTIYRADGVSCRDRLAPRSSHGARSPFVFDVPPWWIGPIWVRFRAPGRKALGAARLEFGLHRKQLRVRAGTTVTCRRSIPEDEPLRVVCPGGWMVEAGVGWHPAARDANWGWQNEGDVASRGDADVHELFLNLFGRTGEEFAALVHDFDATHGRPG